MPSSPSRAADNGSRLDPELTRSPKRSARSDAPEAHKNDALMLDWESSVLHSPPFPLRWRRHRTVASDASSTSSALSLACTSMTSLSPPPSSTLSPTLTESSHDQHGFISGICAVPESPPRGRNSNDTPRPVVEIMSVPFRPKQRNRESWDSAIGSDLTGLRTRGNSAAGMDEAYHSQILPHHDAAYPPPLPASDGILPGATVVCFRPAAFAIHERPPHSEVPSALEQPEATCTEPCDETSSDTTVPAEDAAGRILNYTLDVAFGLGSHNVDASVCRSVVHNFISDLGWAVDQAQAQKEADDVLEMDHDQWDVCPSDTGAGDHQQPSRTTSSASNATRTSQGSGRGGARGKRKSREGRDQDQDGDEGAEEGDARQPEPGPSKRAKLEPGVRMSCPYRKRNPLRFNVRDHRLCALTVFTDTAELRRHIQDCHRRPPNSPHRCPRCQEQFSSAESLRSHLLFPDNVLCPIVETVYNDDMHNPEDGIDNATAEKLRSKKGRVSDSIDVQWQKIWDLLFPDTKVQPYEYCAVMEHHELYAKYMDSVPSLRTSLPAIGLGERGLETLERILTNHFIELFEQCTEEGRRKDYRNRQPKTAMTVLPQQQHQQQPAAAATGGQLRKQSSLRQRLVAAQRDSGFVEDDQSMPGSLHEVGGASSSEGGPGFCTPAFTSDDGSSPGPGLGKTPQNLKTMAAQDYRLRQAPGLAPGYLPTDELMGTYSANNGAEGISADHPAHSINNRELLAHDFSAYDSRYAMGSAADLSAAGGADFGHQHLQHGGLQVYGGSGMLTTMDFLNTGAEQDSTSAWVYNQSQPF